MSVHKYRTKPGAERWRVNYDLPPAPDGRRRRGTKRGFKKRREAVAWEDELRGRLAAGETPTDSRDNVGVFLETWVDGHPGKATTVASYRMHIRAHILPHLGGYRLGELQPEHVDRMYRWLEREGGRRGQGLAPKTVRNIHVVLRRALADAVAWGKVRRNVAALAHPPSTKATKSRNAERVWTPLQLRQWMTHIADDRLSGPWMLVATTGLRRGEVCGLHWRDVDLDAGSVKIRWELTVADNQLVWVDGAKSPAGERVVALGPATVAALQRHRVGQFEERLASGAAYEDHDLVVSWPDGTPMHPDRMLRALYRHAKALGLPRIDVHGLRHSYATLALEAGERPEVVAMQLGHTDVATTLGVYAHVRQEARRDMAERTERWITG